MLVSTEGSFLVSAMPLLPLLDGRALIGPTGSPTGAEPEALSTIPPPPPPPSITGFPNFSGYPYSNNNYLSTYGGSSSGYGSGYPSSYTGYPSGYAGYPSTYTGYPNGYSGY